MTTHTNPCDSLDDWGGVDAASWAEDGGKLTKAATDFKFLTLALPADTADHYAQAAFPTVGNMGWYHYVVCRATDEDAGAADMNGYALEVRDEPGQDLVLYRAVAGVFTPVATWPAVDNPIAFIRVQALGAGATVEVEGWQYDYVVDDFVSVGTYSDVHATRRTTGDFLSVGGYGPTSVDIVEISDVGEEEPPPEEEDPEEIPAPGGAFTGKSWMDGPRDGTSPGSVFEADTQITAEDGTNAAKLAGEGFVAAPTSNWTVGQKITIGTYAFHWNGSAWTAGAHP